MRTNYVPLADPKAFIGHHVIQLPSYFRVAKSRYEHPHILLLVLFYFTSYFLLSRLALCVKKTANESEVVKKSNSHKHLQ